MYQVKLGNRILYHPGSDDAVIYTTDLNEEIGMAGEFKFKVPSDNPEYPNLTTGALVTILKDGDEYWRGEIRDIKTDFAKIADVYVVEDLAWLGDEYLTPASITTETYAQRFQTAISTYNANRPAERQFTAGYLTNVTSSDICNWTTEYDQSLLECLRNCICQDSGYIRVRRVTSGGTTTRYIDIVRLEDYGVQATQAIEYGYNLLDYVKDSDYSNITNVVTPYGEETDTAIYEGYNARLQGTTISQGDSIAAYGRHAKAVIFDGITDLTDLNAAAQNYLTRYSQPQLTMEVKAVDLEYVENADAIRLGDSVRIIARPFAIDQWLYLTQIRRDLQNIDKNTITMSGYVQTGKTLTSQIIGTADAVKNIPSKSSILDAAFKQVIALLDGVDGGVVTFHTNEDDQIDELRIANNIDYDQATKCWRWNLGGFAFLQRSTPNDSWSAEVAMTMNGEIVADFITAGTMSCDRLNGGTINGQTINGGTITGTTINGGSINGATIISENGGKHINISGSDVQLYGTSGAGFVRIYEGNKTGSFYPYEFGISSHYSHASWNNGGTYLQVASHEIIEAADSYSDKRLKQNIRTADDEAIKELILNAKIKQFERTYDPEHGRFGVIAQDVRKQVDKTTLNKEKLKLTMTDDQGYYEIDYKEYIPMLMRMIQLQNEEIKNINKELKKLKGEENG